MTRRRLHLGAASALAALACALLATACESEASREAKRKQVAEAAAHREKLARAEALFKERCKSAGLIVHRVVKDVEGIQLLRIRKPTPWGGKEYFDPMWEDAALAATSQGDDFIKDFLLSEIRRAADPESRTALRRPERPLQAGELPMRPGYAFVEVVDPADGVRYRYTLPRIENPSLNGVEGEIRRAASIAPLPRYAFTFVPIVDPHDRALWIAGVKLQAIDQRTGEVLGELTRYVVDRGFGRSSTGRWPWQHANGSADRMCPSSAGETTGYTHRHFIDNVLVPKQGD